MYLSQTGFLGANFITNSPQVSKKPRGRKKKHTILLRRFESLCFAAGIENFSKGDLYIGCLFFFFSALYKNFRML